MERDQRSLQGQAVRERDGCGRRGDEERVLTKRERRNFFLERYRRWSQALASGGGAGALLGLGLVLLSLAPFAVAALGLSARWNWIVAGLIALVGAVAAFDAWATAMVRGRVREAWGRAGVIALMFGGFALIALRTC